MILSLPPRMNSGARGLDLAASFDGCVIPHPVETAARKIDREEIDSISSNELNFAIPSSAATQGRTTRTGQDAWSISFRVTFPNGDSAGDCRHFAPRTSSSGRNS